MAGFPILEWCWDIAAIICDPEVDISGYRTLLHRVDHCLCTSWSGLTLLRGHFLNDYFLWNPMCQYRSKSRGTGGCGMDSKSSRNDLSWIQKSEFKKPKVLSKFSDGWEDHNQDWRTRQCVTGTVILSHLALRNNNNVYPKPATH